MYVIIINITFIIITIINIKGISQGLEKQSNMPIGRLFIIHLQSWPLQIFVLTLSSLLKLCL